MKKWLIVLMIAWYFLHVSRGYNDVATVVGPFNSESQCQDFRKSIKGYVGFTTPCWYGKIEA